MDKKIYYIKKDGKKEDVSPNELIEKAKELGYGGFRNEEIYFTSDAARVLRKNGYEVGRL